MRGRSREGFSLIEALVALAIASLTLVAIFELQIQMARGQQRAQRAISQSAMQENALALTRTINPMEEPEGVLTLPGGDVVRWVSAPKAQPVRNTGFPSGQGVFMVQLFTMTVTIQPGRGDPPAPLVFDRLGWERQEVQSAAL